MLEFGLGVTPRRHDGRMASTTEFRELVRSITAECKANSLLVPSFRTPPRAHDRKRTIRRYRDGSTLISVRIYQRPVEAVKADMVEGVILANGLSGEAAGNVRLMFGLPPTNSEAA